MAGEEEEQQTNAWAGRPALAFMVRAAAFIVPILASIAASIWLSTVLPKPGSLITLVGWWIAIIGFSTTVLFLVDRLARRLLPLAALMQLTMVFPDKAPKRYRTALKSGSSVKHLKAQIEHAESEGISDDLTEAAQFILQLTSKLNTHDHRTRGHAERVRAYSEMLAEEMGLDEADRAKLRWASLLHDIGKLKVPAEILNKPGALDDAEWDEIKKHPTFGAELCAPLLDWLGPWAATIENHHERFDGNGYPNGRKGDEISLGGRIVCVADAYDVMTTVRSYKKAMTALEAREELARNASSQFDPEVVRAFLNISMGKLRWVAGPLSWLAQLPLLRFLGAVQQVGSTVGVAGLAAAASVGAVGAGIVDLPADATPELPPVSAAQAAALGLDPNTLLPITEVLNASIVADVANAVENGETVIPVLANDVVESGALVSIVQQPGFGTVILNPDGTVTYIPLLDFVGDDSFIYGVIQGDQVVGTAAVLITVEATNDPPQAVDDAASTAEDTTVVVEVLANDTDDSALVPGSVEVVIEPFNGSVGVNRLSGVITYSPEANFSGTDGFTYKIADEEGEESTARVSVVVEPINDAPVARNDNATVAEDSAVAIAVRSNDSDVDDPLLSPSITKKPSTGTATVVAGEIEYRPAANYYGSDGFTYRLCDSGGLCDTANVSVKVGAVNDTPTLGPVGPLSTTEFHGIGFAPLDAASDADGDPLTISAPVASANGGTVVVNGDGSVSYTPPTGFTGTDKVTYTIEDGNGGSTTGAVTVLVTSDLPPVVGSLGPLTVLEFSSLNLVPLSTATDPEDDAMSVSAGLLSAKGGSVVVNDDDSITYAPPLGYLGVDSVTFTVSDVHGNGTTVTFDITVKNVNEAPTATDDGFVITEDSTLAVAVPGLVANDSDPDGDPLAVTLASPAVVGSLTLNGDGSFVFIPPLNWSGSTSFEYTISDGDGAWDVGRVFITVIAVNDPPIATDDGGASFTTAENAAFTTANVTANDTDVEDGTPDPTTVVVVGPTPPGLVNNGNGTFDYTPPLNFNGDATFDYRVDDSVGASSNIATVTLTVNDVNSAPVLDPVGNKTIAEGVALGFTATASDPDLPANTLTFSLAGEPSGASITAGGVFTWTPTEAQGPGLYTFDVEVTDDGTPALSDTETIDVTVNEANVAPTLDPVGDKTIAEGVALGFTATASDPDLPANTLTFSLSGEPSGASITAGGVFTWTPTEAQGPGLYTFDVEVTDDGTPALSDTETIDVTVGEANVAPTLDPVGDKTIAEGVALGFTATASDPDLPANTLTFSLSGEPSGASITAGGVFTWTPTEAQGPGLYTFDVEVTDDGTPALSDTETIDVTVNEANVAPTLDPVGDKTIAEGVALGFTATASDPDLPANTLTFSLSGEPSGASITAGGVFTWTPTEAQGPGLYTFDVEVTDDGTPALSDTETIDVTVNEVNVAPVASDDTFGVDENVAHGTTVGTVSATDVDVPAQTLSFAITAGNVGGAFDIDAAGKITVENPPGLDHEALDAYTLTVTVTDDGAPNLADTATITINVNDVNDAPTAVDDPASLGDPDFEVVRIDPGGLFIPASALLGNDSDPESQPLTVVTASGTTVNGQPYSCNASGCTFDNSGASVGTDTFTYQIQDSAPLVSNTATITIEVVDWGPSPDSGAVIVNEVFYRQTGGGLPIDNDEAIELYNSSPLPVDLSGWLVVDGNPVVGDFDPSAWSYVIPPGTTLAGGGYAVIWLGIDQSGTLPGFTNVPGGVDIELYSGSPPILGNGGDDIFVLDAGRRLVDYVAWGPTPGLYRNVPPPAAVAKWDPGNETSLQPAALGQSISLTPNGKADVGSFCWELTTSGTAGHPTECLAPPATVDADAWVGRVTSLGLHNNTGSPANTSPTLDPVGDKIVDELVALGFIATASDADLPANTLTFSLSGEPAGASITAGGVFSWTPTEAQGPGVYTFDVVVTDDGTPNLFDSETIDVTVSDVNVAPTLDPVGDKTVDELVALGFTATAFDTDLPANTLTFSLAGEPTGASITAGGVFTWTPTEAQGPGVYTFDVVVTDDGVANLADTETIDVTVNEVNIPPVANDDGGVGYTTEEDAPFTTGDVTANDTDVEDGTPDPATVVVVGATPPGLVNNGDGTFNYTPPLNTNGDVTFDYEVDDSLGATSNTATVTITVSPVNDPPSFTKGSDQIVLEDAGAQAKVGWATAISPGPVDESGQSASFNVVSNTNPGLFSAGPMVSFTGTLLFTPAGDANGTATIVIELQDSGSGVPPHDDTSPTQSFDITVTPDNDPPVLASIGDQAAPEGILFSLLISASDIDLPPQPLSFTPAGVPAWASFVDNGNGTATISGTPGGSDVGTSSVTVTVSDGTESDFEVFDLTVTAAGSIVINEVLYRQRTGIPDRPDEFVELFNDSATSVDLTGWRLADGNLAIPDIDAVDPLDFTIPATDVFARSSTLGPGEFAVIWLQSDGGDNQAPLAALEFDAGLGVAFALSNTADDVFLYSDTMSLVDYITYGVGGEINTAPAAPPWSTAYSAANGAAAQGQSISLTPNGQDGDQSACWELTTSSAAAGRPTCAAAPATVAADGANRDASPGLDNNDPYQLSAQAGEIVINEIGYDIANDGEFVEFHNATPGAIDMSGWRISDGNLPIGDLDGGGGRFDFTFPTGPSLPAGGTAVVWVQAAHADNKASSFVDLEFWAGDSNSALAGGDDLWLYDSNLGLVDYVAWGFGGNVNQPPAPLSAFWNPSNQFGLGGTGAGRSISLTANGVDSDDSNCWEHTASAASTCGPPTVDNDDTPFRFASPGDDNNQPTADLSISKIVDDGTPNNGDTITYTITVTNNSQSNAAGGVEVTDALPAGVAWVSDDSAGTYDPFGGVWNLGTVSAASNRTLNIDVTVSAVPGTGVDNDANITASGIPDPDTGNHSASASITVNQPPVAGDDGAATLRDVPVMIFPLGNDSDPDTDPISMTAWDAASSQGGTVDCSFGSSCWYTPPVGFSSGPGDTFTYTIDDGTGLTDTATVTVTVTPLAGAPLFLKTDGTTSEKQLLLLVEPPFLPTSPGTPVPDWNDGGDGNPGLKLDRSGAAPPLDETDDKKFQTWAFRVTDISGLTLSGPMRLQVYSAVKDFDIIKAGELQARLSICATSEPRDSNGCVPLASATASSTPGPWAPSGGFELKTLDFGPVGPVTVPMGVELRVKLVVPSASGDELYIGFDTRATPAVLLPL